MRAKLLLTLISLFLLPTLLLAQFNQWTPDNGVAVREAPSVTFFNSMDTNSDGQTLFAWSEYTQGSRNIMAMLVDNEGSPLWDDAVRICMNEYRQEFPKILALDNGEWFISWADFRHDVDLHSLANIYLQKINSNGTLLLDDQGVMVTDHEYYTTVAPLMVSDGNNGCIISWINYEESNEAIHAQRFDNSGNEVWLAGGITVVSEVVARGHLSSGIMKVIADGNGGAILGFYNLVTAAYPVISMQRINADGEIQWTESTDNTLIIFEDTYYNENFDICIDGNGGAYVVWDLYDTSPLVGQVVGQRVDSEGNFYWAEDGVELTAHVNGFCRKPKLTYAGNNEVVLLYEFVENQNTFEDLRIQKVSGTDEVQLHWGDGESVVLEDTATDYNSYSMATDEDGNTFFTWEALDHTQPFSTVFAQMVNSSGELQWTDGEVNGIIIEGNFSSRRPALSNIPGGDVIYCWSSGTENGNGIQAQILDESGSFQLGDDGLQVRMAINADGFKKQVAKSGENTFVGWLDNRSMMMFPGRVPYIQKLDQDGNILFLENGLCLAPELLDEENNYARECDNLKMCSDNQGGVYAAWNHYGEDITQIITLKRIDQNGDFVWDEAVVLDNENSRDIYTSTIIPLNNNDFLFLYIELNDDWYRELKCMRYDDQGNEVWNEALIIPDENSWDFEYKDVLYDGDNGLYVSYFSVNPLGSVNYYVQKINLDGTLAWDNSILLDDGNISNPDVNSSLNLLNNNLLVTWKTMDHNINVTVKSCLLNENGEFLWDQEIREILTPENEIGYIQCATASPDVYSFWMCWSGLTENNQFDVYVQRFNYEGEPLLEPAEGINLTNSEETYDFLENILVLSDNSLYLVWKEEVEVYNANLKFTHIDANGAIVNSGTPYPENHATLCDAPMYQLSTSLIPSGESGFIAVWRDYRATSLDFASNLYAQKIDDGFTAVNGGQFVAVPDKFEISNTWPNPFNPSINISYYISKATDVKISIYDILGREVAVLLNRKLEAGTHFTHWNGLNHNAYPVASGTYFIQMQTPENKHVRKITLVK